MTQDETVAAVPGRVTTQIKRNRVRPWIIKNPLKKHNRKCYRHRKQKRHQCGSWEVLVEAGPGASLSLPLHTQRLLLYII